MTDGSGRTRSHDSLADQILEKRFDGIEFAGNTFEGVLFIFEALLELLEVITYHVVD